MYFSKLKEKWQKAYRIKSYDDILLNSLTSMFVYKGDNVPDEILKNQSFIGIHTLLNGACAIWKLDEDVPGTGNEVFREKYIITDVNFAGAPDPYGFGEDAIVSTDSGYVATFTKWRDNPNIVIFFNNSIFSPDMNIGRFSDALAELEVSMKLNVLFARMYPMPIAKNAKIQKAIEAAISNMRDGKIATILDEDKLSQYVSDAVKADIETINLTEVEKSEYIQYLAKYRDDLFRWFYSLYGMNSQGSSKMAQQTVDEVNQDSNSSMIIPHDMLRMRQLGCEMAREKFGWNMEVSFSECWMSRLANMDDEFKTTDEELEETDETEDIAKTGTGEEVEETTEDIAETEEEAGEGALAEGIEEIKEEIEDLKETIKEEDKEDETKRV